MDVKEEKTTTNLEALDKIKLIVETLDDLDEQLELLPAQQSEVDMKISDIYHYIENSALTSKNSYRVTKELKELLKERRKLKAEFALVTTLDNNKARLNNKNNRIMLLKDVYKTQKNIQSPYKYRVYDEEEFKSKMEK